VGTIVQGASAPFKMGRQDARDGAVDKHLNVDRTPPGGHELRDECDEKQAWLGVQHIGQKSRGEDARQRHLLRGDERDKLPVGDFWQTEPEHQDCLERHPGGYTCHFARPNWVLPRRAAA